MKKASVLILPSLLAVGLLSACSTPQSNATAKPAQQAVASTTSQAQSSTSQQSTNPNEVKLNMNEFSFSPNLINVKAGEKVHFVLTNSGKVGHDINNNQLKLDKDVDPGKTVTYDWTTPSNPGSYQIICDVPGHKEQGMKLTFNIAK